MCWVTWDSRGLPGEGGRVGTGARELHKHPSGWMSHSPGEGGKKEQWGGGGTDSSLNGLTLPKASAHLTDGKIEAQKVAELCPGCTVQTRLKAGESGQAGGPSPWLLLGRIGCGGREKGVSVPHYSLPGLS